MSNTSTPTKHPSSGNPGATLKKQQPPGVAKAMGHQEKIPFGGVYPVVALKDRPEWDGIHGRLIQLLPRQNQFTVSRNLEFTITKPPEKPVEELIDVNRYTKFEVGQSNDNIKQKEWKKSGKVLSRAGMPVFIRINPDSVSRNHDLIGSDGLNMVTKNILFYEEWKDAGDRKKKAERMVRMYKNTQLSIKVSYDLKMKL